MIVATGNGNREHRKNARETRSCGASARPRGTPFFYGFIYLQCVWTMALRETQPNSGWSVSAGQFTTVHAHAHAYTRFGIILHRTAYF